ncbi:MAG: PDZ domain-containing protein [Bacteroidetes bacterium]|nr:PDZ domain-containing protein [Bacteroidota bacterium]MCW5894656.1 PDZ domain-containing protein [Bacteroidota bacterium]
MRVLLLLLALTHLAIFVSPAAQNWSGQGEKKMIRFEAKTTVIIPEIGAVIMEENGKLTVGTTLPIQSSDKSSTFDITKGDEVGMINGKRVGTIAELRESFEQAAIGSEVKLGLRREGRPHIVTFVKKDPKEGSQKMIIRKSDGASGDEDVLPALGIIVRKQKDNVVVAEILDETSGLFKSGDVITSLNGKRIASVQEFSSTFDATAVGGELRFELVRDGKAVSFTMKRPEPRGNVIIKK